MEKAKISLIHNILKDDRCILVAYLFGSQLKERPNKYSDVDIAVLFDKYLKEGNYADKQIAIMSSLSSVLKKEVDVVVLNRASLFLKYHILKEGIKIYENPHRTEHSFEAQAIVQYLDFLPIKNRIESGLLSKIIENSLQRLKEKQKITLKVALT